MAAMRMQDGKEKLIKDIVPLADLNDIVDVYKRQR